MTDFQILYLDFACTVPRWSVAKEFSPGCAAICGNMCVEMVTMESVGKVFSPARFQGNNYLKKRQFEKTNENGRRIFKYSGRAAVLVSKSTPLILDFNTKQEKLTVSFYVQRYDKNDFSFNLSLQAHLNRAD